MGRGAASRRSHWRCASGDHRACRVAFSVPRHRARIAQIHRALRRRRDRAYRALPPARAPDCTSWQFATERVGRARASLHRAHSGRAHRGATRRRASYPRGASPRAYYFRRLHRGRRHAGRSRLAHGNLVDRRSQRRLRDAAARRRSVGARCGHRSAIGRDDSRCEPGRRDDEGPVTDLHVARWKMRYRLPVDSPGDRARLDRALSSAIDQSLFEAALDRAGISSTDELCIRSVESFVLLDLSEPDSRLAVTLSIALANAIAARLREGGDDVVRFASRRQALVDMARWATRGDLARAWAWRRLGVWRRGDFLSPARAREEVVDELTREPTTAVAVLAVIAAEGLLSPLLSSVAADSWTRLAHSVLNAARAHPCPVLSTGEALSASPTRDTDALAARHQATVARIASRSMILRAVGERIDLDLSVARALATLVLFECEPDLVRAGTVAAIVDDLARTIRRTVEAR